MDLIRESVDQYARGWQAMVATVPGALVAEEDGVAAAIMDVPLFIMNTIVLTKPVPAAELEATIARVKRLAAGCSAPWVLGACNDWLPSGASEVLSAHDIHPAIQLTGMVTDTLTPARPAPSELEFRTELTNDLVQALMDVNCAGYGLPMEMGRSSIKPGLFTKDSYCVAGYVDGKPVSATVTFAVDGRLYAGWVATHPEAQRRGYADAVMRRSLADARAATGLSRSVLHATDAGRPVYLKMGYRDVAKFTVFAHGLSH